MERPIIFSSEMVRAIMDGRKTMTRRIVNPQPPEWKWNTSKWSEQCINVRHDKSERPYYVVCPFGKPGDTLWVRESYCPHWFETNKHAFKADWTDLSKESGFDQPKWKPSIHMPRSAARIFLEITDISVERLHGISQKDALAEGVKHVIDKITGYCGYDYQHGGYNLMTTPYNGFASLWKSIHSEESWASNPWVWVIKFKSNETNS